MTRGARHSWWSSAIIALLLCSAGFAASDPNVGWIECGVRIFWLQQCGGARGTADWDQFEQIRRLFHAAFANLRVDPGTVLILAA